MAERPTEVPDAPLSLAGAALQRNAEGICLIGSICLRCRINVFPPSPVCPRCQSEAMAAAEMPRRGRIYAFSTVHAGPKQWIKPYTLAYVDLPNDVRVLAHLRGGEPSLGAEVMLGAGIVGATPDGQAIETYVFDVESH